MALEAALPPPDVELPPTRTATDVVIVFSAVKDEGLLLLVVEVVVGVMLILWDGWNESTRRWNGKRCDRHHHHHSSSAGSPRIGATPEDEVRPRQPYHLVRFLRLPTRSLAKDGSGESWLYMKIRDYGLHAYSFFII